MSVVIETTLGDITVDLFFKERPRACQNFLKLCKLKYYNFNLFHTVSRGFIAQTGDPTGSRNGGESIFGVLEGPLKRFFVAEANPRIKHTIMGLVSFVGNEENMIGSQFFFTLGEELMYLDGKHCVFGQVTEGFDVLELINEAICDSDDRPYQDIRITHTVVLDDPLPDIESMILPSRSPSPSAERLQGGRIAPDEEIDETKGKSMNEINELIAEREAKARANILEMVGDLPDAEMAPPENVLFVCKLNPVTTDDDLEIIFSRFGKIKSCEVIKDHKTGDSLQYAFVEFEEQKSCEDAYFKMDNVLIDDRRIHVDFSQSVSKLKWMGKGRGVRHLEEKINEKKSNVQDKRKGRNKSRSVSSSPERKSRANNYSLNSHKRKVHNDKGYQRNSNYKRGSWDLNEQSSSHQFKSKTEYEKVERRSRSTTPHNDRKRTKSSGKRDEKERSYSSTKSPEISNNNKRKKEKSRLHQISSDEDQRNKQKRKDSIDKRDSKMKNRIKTKQRSSSSSLSSDSGEERKKYKTKDREKYSPSPGKISKSYRGKDTVKSKKRCSSRSVSSDRAEHRKNSYERNLEMSGDRSKISRETKKIKNSRSSSSSEEDIRTKKRYGDKKYGNEKKLSSFHKSKFKKSRLRSSSSRSSSPPKSRKHKRRRTRSTSPRKRK